MILGRMAPRSEVPEAMQLSAQDTARFYRIWWPLLRYVNAQRQVVPDLPAEPEQTPISVQEAHQIRNVLWESDGLREAFIAENPAGLPAADLAIVTSWRHRVMGQFFIFRHLKQYTVFLTEGEPPQAYGVLGPASPIQEVVPRPLPTLVKAVLNVPLRKRPVASRPFSVKGISQGFGHPPARDSGTGRPPALERQDGEPDHGTSKDLCQVAA